MKILHSADWHLDAPLGGYSEADAAFLREQLRQVPQKIADLCKSKECDLMLLSGDLFDGTAGILTLQASICFINYMYRHFRSP